MILWLDVETTGLDPMLDFLLEVGMIVTNDDLSEVDRTSIVFPYDGFGMVPEVREMHKKSGLAEECAACEWSHKAACNYLTIWLAKHYDGEPLVVAGNTVSFDRKWIEQEIPGLTGMFHYRSIDVSSLKELNRRWNFAPSWEGDRKIHRALPDLEDSIEELKMYGKWIFPRGVQE